MSRRLIQTCALLVAIAWIPSLDARQTRSKVRKKGSADRVKTVSRPAFDISAINDATWTEPVGPGSSGSAILRVQILLDRAHYSPGEIDGNYGRNTALAIQGFQASRQLEPTGVIDERTWALLNEDLEPAVVPYVVTKEDLSEPYEKIPADMVEKSKLKALGYESAEEELGEKFHIKPALLIALNRGKDIAQPGVEIMAPNILTNSLPGTADFVVVSKTRSVLQAVAADGTVLAQYPATIGSDKDPLPLGTWKITIVQRNPVFNYNPDLFWDADPSHSKAKIMPGPNNPVGAVWVGLSKEHYGIHGAPEPGNIGHTESHGCIRLTNWDAKELASMVKSGQQVILQEP